jgi:lipase chaperone LimK
VSFLQREKVAAATLSMVSLLLLFCVMKWPPQMSDTPVLAPDVPRAVWTSAPPDDVMVPVSFPAAENAAPAPDTASAILARMHSLRGAALPDGLRVDDSGALITDLQLKLLFDFLLAARHDVSAAELQTLLQARARALPQPAAQQALLLWQNYRQYQADVELLVWELKPDAAPDALSAEQLQTIATLFTRREQLQQDRLGDLADRWFGEDNAYDRRMLERMQSLPSQARATAAAVAPDVPQQIATDPWLQAAYEQQRDQLRLQADLTPQEQSALLESLRRDYFPAPQEQIRQSLRDLAQGHP